MKIKVIGDEFTCLGFALSGISTVTAENEETVAEELDKALGDNDVGIILVTENEANLIRDKIEEQKTEGEMPLVVEIPSRAGWKQRGKALDLIKRVLSISV